MLFAKCQESPDKERHTTVDLNKCLGHKDGTLVRGYVSHSMIYLPTEAHTLQRERYWES